MTGINLRLLTEDELAKAKEACQVMLKKFEDRVGELADKKTREIQEG